MSKSKSQVNYIFYGCEVEECSGGVDYKVLIDAAGAGFYLCEDHYFLLALPLGLVSAPFPLVLREDDPDAEEF